MKNIKWIVVLVLFVGVLSCKKTESTSVKVNVYDENANRPVSNVHVILYLEEVGNNYALITNSRQNNFSSIAEKYTDANGNVDFGSFNAYKNKKCKYYVTIGDGNDLHESSHFVNKGEDNNITINLKGQSTLTLTFTPPPPYGVGDSLRVEFYKQNYLANSHPIRTNITYLTNSNQFYVYYGTYYFIIDKYKLGIYTHIQDTIFYDDDSAYVYNVNW